MSSPIPKPLLPVLPDWRTVLGLSEPGEVDWGRVRAAQLNVTRRVAPLRLAITLVGVALVAFNLRQTAPMIPLLGWLTVIALIAIKGALPKMRERRWQLQTATLAELHRENGTSSLMGVAWASAPMLFAPFANHAGLLLLWAVCTVMMSGAAFVLSVLPLATTFYILSVGFALALSMARLGYELVALVAIIYAIGLTLACLMAGRKFIMHEAAQQALAEKNEVVSLLLREFDDKGGDWMWQTDAAKCLTHVSPRFAFALGVEPATLEAQPLLRILAGDAWEAGNFSAALRELGEKLKQREAFTDLTLPVVIAGETHWWELSASPRHDERGQFLGFRGVGSDVTAQRRSADKINHMARFDTLTGLPNRLHLTEALQAAMQQAEQWRGKCAFMMIDLDRFKQVNDTLGHPIGDRLLTRVADRLKSLMDDKDMCGRLGGDEFGVVIADAAEPARLSRLANAIIEALSQPYEVDQHTLYIGASIGTAIGPRDGRSVETLIRSADLALYRSKDEGGGAQTAYEPQLHANAEERRVIEIALRRALERQELSIHYQPLVGAETGQIESFEALLRWKNPELGFVSPAKFIPIAEDTRLIGPIGDWVLHSACAEAVRWPEAIRVAVNVSAEQLTNPHFVTTVMQALAQSRLAPHRLEIEVTESIFLRGGNSVAVLDRLIGLGVGLALDDFGTGYSSLGYLSKVKFNTIKIDRSFVSGAAKNVPEAIAIIRAVVAMAESLGMSTTAEGVETDGELALVRKLGCRKIQGYLFGRPMPAGDARRLFDRDRAVA